MKLDLKDSHFSHFLFTIRDGIVFLIINPNYSQYVLKLEHKVLNNIDID